MTFMPTTGQAPVPPVNASATPGSLRMTPGRWAALAIGVPVALALIGWTGFSLVGAVAKASYPFSYQVPVQGGHVALNLNFGNVVVRQTSGATAVLTGVVQYGLFRPGISENTIPGGASVGVNCDGIDTNCNANATLDVPAKTAVTLSSGGGDIGVSGFASNLALSADGGNVTANNLAGGLQLDTGGGDLTGNALAGTIQIRTEGGNVNATNLNGTGTMRLDTGGGDVTDNGLTGNLLLVTEGGNVNADAVDSRVATIQSGGGDVTVAFTQPPQDLQITASGGNVTVILPQDHTKYRISTPDTQGGNVNYPASLASSTSQHVITVDSGGGDVSLTEG